MCSLSSLFAVLSFTRKGIRTSSSFRPYFSFFRFSTEASSLLSHQDYSNPPANSKTHLKMGDGHCSSCGHAQGDCGSCSCCSVRFPYCQPLFPTFLLCPPCSCWLEVLSTKQFRSESIRIGRGLIGEMWWSDGESIDHGTWARILKPSCGKLDEFRRCWELNKYCFLIFDFPSCYPLLWLVFSKG